MIITAWMRIWFFSDYVEQNPDIWLKIMDRSPDLNSLRVKAPLHWYSQSYWRSNLKCKKAKRRMKNGTGRSSSLSPCSRPTLLLQMIVWLGLLLLAQLVEEEQAPGPALLSPLSHWEVSSAVGVKYCQADIFLLWNMDASLVWARACLCLCICVRLTGGQRSLCRQRLGSTPELGKQQQQCLLLTPCPMSSYPCSSSSSSSSSCRCYCSLCADSMQRAMWCVSALSSGLSTVCVRRKVGSLSMRSGGNEKPN